MRIVVLEPNLRLGLFYGYPFIKNSFIIKILVNLNLNTRSDLFIARMQNFSRECTQTSSKEQWLLYYNTTFIRVHRGILLDFLFLCC